MDANSLATCGVLCDLCLGFQRKKDTCVGCNEEGFKPYHCTVCSIKLCPEKHGDPRALCSACQKFPCRRIKALNKRYVARYGEDLLDNFRRCEESGISAFIEEREEFWKCASCGELLCVHRETCMNCGAVNLYFPGGTEKN